MPRLCRGMTHFTSSSARNSSIPFGVMPRRKCLLRSLSIGDNRIRAAGAYALAYAVASCQSLRHLAIHDNPLTNDGVTAIAAALVPEGVELPGGGASRPALEAGTRSKVETLNVSGCPALPDGCGGLGRSGDALGRS